MSYIVILLESAESELTDLWLDAPDRDQVTVAAYEIELRLRTLSGCPGAWSLLLDGQDSGDA